MANQADINALRAMLSRYPSLDPNAVMAISGHEGLSGGIGDNGTSFGPFQLHLGGAYPSWAPHGSPQQDNAWAWSPQGLQYALNQINQVAGGLHGLPAISAISRRFERPANPAAEIADAAAHYGHGLQYNPAMAGGSAMTNPALMAGGAGPSMASPNAAAIMGLVNFVLHNNATRPLLPTIGGA